MNRIPGSKQLALQAISGEATDRVPVALFTWGFDYYWQLIDLQPWQLACGNHETWHAAHMAIVQRHAPDMIFYEGPGLGDLPPKLIEDTSSHWLIQDGNSQQRYRLLKDSLTLVNEETHKKNCDPVGTINSKADADELIPDFMGWGESYLNGLRRLIDETGDRGLVVPHHSPAYICACYAFGFERAMETMVCNPELFRYVCEKYRDGDKLRMQEWAAAGAEVVFIADGWASCDVISPNTVEEMALPYQRSITEAAHEAGLKIVLWNEGNILPILDMEAAIPFDAFAFEQPRKGEKLTVEKIRQTFGPRRCLFGNFDSELLLMRGDPVEIREAVQSQIRQSGPGSPFVFSTGSPLPSNVSPDVVDIMMAAARMGYGSDDSK